jgi:type IX secretion system PorP/SprF family membrane protein
MKFLYTIGLLISCVFGAIGQDLHFSQYYHSPLTTNPANTGFLPDHDFRIGVNYRTQYSNVMYSPYKTMSAFVDAQVLRNRFEYGWLGLGAVILSDEAGAGSLKSNKFYASIAYHQMLGMNSLLSAGFNLGYADKRIDITKLKFPDQFDGRFFDGSLPTTVQLQDTKVGYFDMQAGINYALFPSDDMYFQVGYSIHHVNKPRETFFGDDTENSLIPMRHIGFASAIIKATPSLIVQPSLYYAQQAKSSELVGGATLHFNLSEFGEKQLILGAHYRLKDAAIGVAGFELNGIRFTFSYDATMSNLNKYNNYRGAAEFSLIKTGLYPENIGRETRCPSF